MTPPCFSSVWTPTRTRSPTPKLPTASPASPCSCAVGTRDCDIDALIRRLKSKGRIQDIGCVAQVRLCKRYRRLRSRGKHPNTVAATIARELGVERRNDGATLMAAARESGDATVIEIVERYQTIE